MKEWGGMMVKGAGLKKLSLEPKNGDDCRKSSFKKSCALVAARVNLFLLKKKKLQDQKENKYFASRNNA
ncbi:MAG: hypothetical protein JW727_06425 [Candidatus Aenigmarchaeota archaeon]|nr:hypothetical protein [Candidatus Aenigmarchaeota archaeon]